MSPHEARDEFDHLTPRQREIAKAAATTSLSNKELAATLGISEGTLKLHLNAIYRRLGIDGRRALIVGSRTQRIA